MRLLVKTLSEDEHDGIVHIHSEDDDLVERIHSRLTGALDGERATPDAQLAALGRLIGDLMDARAAASNPLSSAQSDRP
jgi:uncharacterized protein YejL (UPF0352 family)